MGAICWGVAGMTGFWIACAQETLRQYGAMAGGLEKGLALGGPGGQGGRRAGGWDPMTALPASVANVHDFIMHLAARLERLQERLSGAKEAFLADGAAVSGRLFETVLLSVEFATRLSGVWSAMIGRMRHDPELVLLHIYRPQVTFGHGVFQRSISIFGAARCFCSPSHFTVPAERGRQRPLFRG